MIRFQALAPSKVRWWCNNLRQPQQKFGHLFAQIVIEQDDTGIKLSGKQPVILLVQGYQFNCPVGTDRKFCRFCNVRVQSAYTGIVSGLNEQVLQGADTFKVRRVTRVVFGYDKYPDCVRAGLVKRCLGRLDTQRGEFGIDIIKAGGEQIGVYWRHLVSRIPDIDRGIKWRFAFQPLFPEPRFDDVLSLQQVCLNRMQRSGQCSRDVWRFM